MPMIEVYSPTGTFSDKNCLAQDLVRADQMRWEVVPDIPLFAYNTAARTAATGFLPSGL